MKFLKNHRVRCMITGVGLILTSLTVFGQSAVPYNQTYLNSYYSQKTTLFELLPQSGNDIIFLGNSITDIGEWAEIWQNIHVKNRGISSDITAGVLARLDPIIAGKPAKLFILIGINDIARNIPDSIILQNYEAILSKVSQGSPGTKVYVQSILPTNETFTEYINHQNKSDHILAINQALGDICRRLRIDLIDLHALFADQHGRLNNQFTNDGLHLNGPGYLRWKKYLEEKGYCCD